DAEIRQGQLRLRRLCGRLNDLIRGGRVRILGTTRCFGGKAQGPEPAGRAEWKGNGAGSVREGLELSDPLRLAVALRQKAEDLAMDGIAVRDVVVDRYLAMAVRIGPWIAHADGRNAVDGERQVALHRDGIPIGAAVVAFHPVATHAHMNHML